MRRVSHSGRSPSMTRMGPFMRVRQRLLVGRFAGILEAQLHLAFIRNPGGRPETAREAPNSQAFGPLKYPKPVADNGPVPSGSERCLSGPSGGERSVTEQRTKIPRNTHDEQGGAGAQVGSFDSHDRSSRIRSAVSARNEASAVDGPRNEGHRSVRTFQFLLRSPVAWVRRLGRSEIFLKLSESSRQ